MCESPFSLISFGVLFSSSSLSMKYFPLSTFASPAKASISSVCPFPCTPAIPSTSPSRISNETPLTFSIPPLFTVKFSTFTTTLPNFTSGLLTSNSTTRPTIRLAIFSFVASLVFNSPTSLPRRITVILSDKSSTSCNLCEIKIIVFPSFIRFLIIS